MKNLKNLKFKAKRWDDSTKEVEGQISLIDHKTLKEADPEVNRNGYLMVIINEDGKHLVQPDSVELITVDPRAEKWEKLEAAIAPYYDEEDERYSDEEGLLIIGEIAASHLGYL